MITARCLRKTSSLSSKKSKLIYYGIKSRILSLLCLSFGTRFQDVCEKDKENKN